MGSAADRCWLRLSTARCISRACFLRCHSWEGLGLAAMANIAGQFGDLCELAFNAAADVKDSGTLLPGSRRVAGSGG